MDFSKLTAYLDSLKDVGVPGCDLSVMRAHAPIYRHFTGYRDREAGIHMDGSEIYWIYSATKVHTCVAALQLIESGYMGLDDPVSKYLRAFGTLSVCEDGRVRAATEIMTIRHLMSMRGGLSYDLHSPSIEKAILYSSGRAGTRAIVDAIAEEPLLFNPGTHFKYSLCHDVLAAVIEAVSGMSFGDYMQKRVWRPLGIYSAGFTLTPDKRARLCKQYLYDESSREAKPHPDGDSNCYQLTPNYESGGAGMLSSVSDYMLLADALACGGVGATGERVLKPETVELMRTNQLAGACMDDYLREIPRYGYGYGLGVRTLIDARNSKSPLGEFGWDGAACAYTLIDPKNKLSAYFGIALRGFGYGYEKIHPAIRDMIYECVGLR